MGTAGAPDETGLFYPELSPDGNRVAVTRARVLQNNADVWLIDLARGGSATRFTLDPAFDYAPLWSPDGTRIAFRSNRKESTIYDLYVKPSSGGPNEELLFESAASKSPLSWSSEGKFLLFYQQDPQTNYDLWTLTSDGKASPWLKTPDIETLGQFSPNGRWVAYQSNEFGPFEIYVQPFPTANAKWPISTNGGSMPRWRSDGKELFYIAPDAKLMAVAVAESNATFEHAPPVALFQTRIVGDPGQILKHQYAVSRDGRFLINETAEASTAEPITLIVNWKP
jgi:Tol biopolymer transport system component